MLLKWDSIQFRGEVKLVNSTTMQFHPTKGLGRGYRLVLDYTEVVPEISWIRTSEILQYKAPVVTAVTLPFPESVDGRYKLTILGENLGLTERANATSIRIFNRNSGQQVECFIEWLQPTEAQCWTSLLQGLLVIDADGVEGPSPPFQLVATQLLKPAVLDWVGAASCSSTILEMASKPGAHSIVLDKEGASSSELSSVLSRLEGPFPNAGHHHGVAVGGRQILWPDSDGGLVPVSAILVATNETVASGGLIYSLGEFPTIIAYYRQPVPGTVPAVLKSKAGGFGPEAAEELETLLQCDFGCYEIPVRLGNCDAVAATPSKGEYEVNDGEPSFMFARSMSQEEDVVVFDLPPGQGHGWRLLLRVGEEVSINAMEFSYSPPQPFRVTSMESGTSIVDISGGWVLIKGVNFGWRGPPDEESRHQQPLPHDLPPRKVVIADLVTDTQQECVGAFQNDSTPQQGTIECYVAGGFSGYNDTAVGITVAGVTRSVTGVMSFKPPVVDSISPQGLSTAGGQRIRLEGGNWGIDPVVRIGNFECTDAKVLSAQLLTCTLPEGKGKDNPVVITNRHQSSSCKAEDNRCKYTYQAPFVATVSPAIAAHPLENAAPSVIRIEGESFGPAGSASVRFWGDSGNWMQLGCQKWDGLQPNPSLASLMDLIDTSFDVFVLDPVCFSYFPSAPGRRNFLRQSHTVLEVLMPMGIVASFITGELRVAGQIASFIVPVHK